MVNKQTLKIMSLPVKKRMPRHGRRFYLFRKRAVHTDAHIDVKPLVGNTVNRDLIVIDGYYVIVEIKTGALAMSAEDALVFSQALSLAYALAQRLEKKFKGKYFDPSA